MPDPGSATNIASRVHVRWLAAVFVDTGIGRSNDRHHRAAPDRAGDDGRPAEAGECGALQLRQLPLGRPADRRARRREPRRHVVQGHGAKHPADRGVHGQHRLACHRRGHASDAADFPPDMDELAAAGFTAVPGVKVASPWIREAPAAFECRRYLTLELGKSRQIILGEIVYAHYRSDVVDTERLRIDPARLDSVPRACGSTASRPAGSRRKPRETFSECFRQPRAARSKTRVSLCSMHWAGSRSGWEPSPKKWPSLSPISPPTARCDPRRRVCHRRRDDSHRVRVTPGARLPKGGHCDIVEIGNESWTLQE